MIQEHGRHVHLIGIMVVEKVSIYLDLKIPMIQINLGLLYRLAKTVVLVQKAVSGLNIVQT